MKNAETDETVRSNPFRRDNPVISYSCQLCDTKGHIYQHNVSGPRVCLSKLIPCTTKVCTYLCIQSVLFLFNQNLLEFIYRHRWVITQSWDYVNLIESREYLVLRVISNQTSIWNSNRQIRRNVQKAWMKPRNKKKITPHIIEITHPILKNTNLKEGQYTGGKWFIHGPNVILTGYTWRSKILKHDLHSKLLEIITISIRCPKI